MIKMRVRKKLMTARGPSSLEVDLTMARELVSLYGPSGAGKTSVLRMLAGLTDPDEGIIEVNGQVWFDSTRRINVPVQKRGIGFLFQDYNLFPNMTVRENLRYALHFREDEELIDELLAMVHLTELQGRKPPVLSGGQRQRVALIRTLLSRPQMILLDEPLSALDISLRLKLQDDICALYERFKIPMVIVTHDLGEVFKLAHTVYILEEGKIVRSGRPGDLFADDLSGKFKFVGIILEMTQEDFLCIITVQIGHNISKVVATAQEAAGWRIGDRVMVAAKAFNPVIMKI